ncbi:MAG: phosphoadenosine phosphosulfate reductase family protein [Phycisphaerae bacterium]|nr:phosphoadenosine phosphosulfate reductase family protein [Phycisphaerae bacterium]
MKRTSEDLISEAIDRFDPSHVILAISGGYDSLCMAHYVHENIKFDKPLLTYAIDTQMAADGWREWIDSVAHGFGWKFDIYHNTHGWKQYQKWVKRFGQPTTKTGHKRAYARLKDRAFDAMTKHHKTIRTDRILYLTGIRAEESSARSKLQPINGGINKSTSYCNPVFYWTNKQILAYRIEHDIPINPFYETVGGSGDCQCNWGKFITLRKLQKYSPKLAAGNVAIIDRISKEYHGYGWDGDIVGQGKIFEDFEDDGEMCSPFLCEGCSRSKTPKPGLHKAEEQIYEQMEMF